MGHPIEKNMTQEDSYKKINKKYYNRRFILDDREKNITVDKSFQMK